MTRRSQSQLTCPHRARGLVTARRLVSLALAAEAGAQQAVPVSRPLAAAARGAAVGPRRPGRPGGARGRVAVLRHLRLARAARPRATCRRARAHLAAHPAAARHRALGPRRPRGPLGTRVLGARVRLLRGALAVAVLPPLATLADPLPAAAAARGAARGPRGPGSPRGTRPRRARLALLRGAGAREVAALRDVLVGDAEVGAVAGALAGALALAAGGAALGPEPIRGGY